MNYDETKEMIATAVAAAKNEIMENVATMIAHPIQSGGELENLAIVDDLRESVTTLLKDMVGQSFVVLAERSGDNIVFKRRYLKVERGRMFFENAGIPDIIVPAKQGGGGGGGSGYTHPVFTAVDDVMQSAGHIDFTRHQIGPNGVESLAPTTLNTVVLSTINL